METGAYDENSSRPRFDRGFSFGATTVEGAVPCAVGGLQGQPWTGGRDPSGGPEGGASGVKAGTVVWVAAFDDVPEHLFRVDEVYEDCVGGVALTGPLAGAYGEPELELILGPAKAEDVPLGT
jgi:hypothetical protein